jgi:hypothetical protein
MAALASSAMSPIQAREIKLAQVAAFPRMRALAWNGDTLHASRGYELLSAQIAGCDVHWHRVGKYFPARWRNLSSASRLSSRLFRDGFHALAILPSGHFVAAVPGAIITLAPGQTEFQTTHRVVRGTRPLHFAVTPDGRIFWGEYYDNPERAEVHIYVSTDLGASWNIARTFPRGSIRHVHNLVYDRWADCLWVLTGDEGGECRILCASYDFKNVDAVIFGDQQARAVALLPAEDGIYFSTDSPLEANYVYRLDRRGRIDKLASLSSSSIYGCRVGVNLFFSTMVEPSAANPDSYARVYGSFEGVNWQSLLKWPKDKWPMRFFQYGNVIFPDGENTSGMLALTSVAVAGGDEETSLWQVQQQ